MSTQGVPRCCPACVFNPLGCRCRFGELGVAETQDWGPWDDYEEDGPLDLEDQLDNAMERCGL